MHVIFYCYVKSSVSKSTQGSIVYLNQDNTLALHSALYDSVRCVRVLWIVS